MHKSDAHVGQIVYVNSGKKSFLAKVIKINQKNIKVVTADGVRWNCHPIYLRQAFESEIERYEAEAEADATAAAPLTLGTLVRFKSGRDGNYVVVGNHGGLWRVAVLGGDNGRYIRGVSADQLEIIDFNVES